MTARSRLGEEGYGVRRVGSFAGKTPTVAGGPHPVGIITRLALDGYGARRYSSFAGKQLEIIVPVVPETPPTSSGSGGIASSTKRKPAVYVDGFRRVQHDLKQIKSFEELKSAIEAAPQAQTKPPATLAPLSSLFNPEPIADPQREAALQRALQLMRDDDEAIALLLLN